MKPLFTIAISLLLQLPLFAQAEKYVELYHGEDYKKSFKQCEKAISKDRSDLKAYLYKAMNQVQLAGMDDLNEKYRQSIYGAALSLGKVIKKDEQGIFAGRYMAEINWVRQAILDEGVRRRAKSCRRAGKYFEKLIEMFEDPEAHFYLGQCQLEAGETVEGIRSLNNAARIIYTSVKSGTLEQAMLPESFTGLAFALYEDYAIEEALTIMERAIEIFPEEEQVKEASLELTAAVGKQQLSMNDTAQANRLLQYYEWLEGQYEEPAPFFRDKWDFIGKQSRKYLSSGKVEESGEMIHNYLFRSPVRQADSVLALRLINELIIETTGPLGYSEKQAHEQGRYMAYLLLDTYKKFEKIKGKTEVDNSHLAESIIRKKLDSQSYLLAGRLLYHFHGDPALEGMIDRLQVVFIDQLIPFLEGQAFHAVEKEMSVWLSFFPDSQPYRSFYRERQLRQAEQFLAAEDFSSCAPLFRNLFRIFPDDAEVGELFENYIWLDFKKNYEGTATGHLSFSQAPGADDCAPASYPAELDSLFLRRLNYYRRLAGIPDQCVLSTDLGSYCREAAHLMSVNGKLNHNPNKDWHCYNEDAYRGASNSNLSLGYHSVNALNGQMADYGASNTAVGHRRWIIFPFRKVYGHGSSQNSMALWALGSDDSNYPDSIQKIWKREFVAWPPEGYVPSKLVYGRWSFSLYAANFEDARVSMKENGQEIELEQHPVKGGYGLNTIVWEPERAFFFPGVINEYEIHIQNVKAFWLEEPVNFTYTVRVLPMSNN